MRRPQVRQVQSQNIETNDIDINSSEAEELLRKYGYDDQVNHNTIKKNDNKENTNKGLSFEEMVAQQQEKEKRERDRKLQKRNSSKPITFDGKNGYRSETKWGSDPDSGFGFKIEINSDMDI